MSYGRRRIFTDETKISTENVIAEVEAAYPVHSDNRTEIEKLYEYYRNKTAIEAKTKAVREDINYKIGEARCLEVTNFYKGYIFGEPIQYVRREKSQNGMADDVTNTNDHRHTFSPQVSIIITIKARCKMHTVTAHRSADRCVNP